MHVRKNTSSITAAQPRQHSTVSYTRKTKTPHIQKKKNRASLAESERPQKPLSRVQTLLDMRRPRLVGRVHPHRWHAAQLRVLMQIQPLAQRMILRPEGMAI